MNAPFSLRVVAWVPFVASAAVAAVAIQLSIQTPLMALVFAGLALSVHAARWAARRRTQRLLTSGDADAVLGAWQEALRRIPHPDTMVPLIAATALGANGLTERARGLLRRASKGAAWDAALEHRLLVETLLEAFDGDRSRAVSKANQLSALPLPPIGPFGRDHVRLLRSAIRALALAFTHEAELNHAKLMLRAARRNPLVFWPLRYAAAVACLDHGQPARARALLNGAPEWPEDSVFSSFHRELLGHCDSRNG